MDRQNLGGSGLLVVLAGMLAVGVPQGLRSTIQTTSATEQLPLLQGAGTIVQATEQNFPRRGASDLLNEFLVAQDRGERPPSAARDSGVSSVGLCSTSVAGHYKLQFLIAILPEPVAPPLRYIFDGHMDAIERAAESSNFVLDRSYLPWPSLNANEYSQRIEIEQLARGTEPDRFHDPVIQAAERYLREPGVILFRNTSSWANGNLLLLFIVGETPTEGVRKDALFNALNQVADLSGWRKRNAPESCAPAPVSDNRTVKLLGPTFSGSVPSLYMAVDEWKQALAQQQKTADLPVLEPKVTIISGSATAVGPDFAKWTHFRATVMPETVTLPVIVNYLEHDLGARKGEIASLAEANTLYGRLSNNNTLDHDPNNNTLDHNPVSDDDSLHLYFPLHIASLRTSLAKRKTAAAQLSVEPYATDVPIPYEEIGTAGYIIPPASPRTTSYDEMTLSNLLWSLHHEHIRYVIIRASDAEDIIFLAQEIRKHSPDTILITTWADLLYLHTEVNSELRGMLIFSTYPLFSMNQVWSYSYAGGRNRLQFPFDVAEGEYNAALVLLTGPESDHYPPRLLEYGLPFDRESKSPGLWIEVVGRDSLWPIAIRKLGAFDSQYLLQVPAISPAYPSAGSGHGLLPISTKSPNPDFGEKPASSVVESQGFHTRGLIRGPFVIVLVLLSVVCTFLSCVLISVFHHPKKRLPPPPCRWMTVLTSQLPLKLFSVFPETSKARLEQRTYLWAFCYWLMTLYLPVFWVFQLALYYVWFIGLDRQSLFVTLLPILGLLGVEAISVVTVVMLLWATSSMRRAVARCASDDGFVEQMFAEPLVGFSAASTALAISYCLRLSFWFLLIVLFLSFLIASLIAVRPHTKRGLTWRGRKKATYLFGPGAVGIAIAITAGLTIWCGRSRAFDWSGARSFYDFWDDGGVNSLFVALRATDLRSGVSPLVPLIFVSVATLCAILCPIRRLHLLSERALDSPYLNFDTDGAKSFKGLGDLERRIEELLTTRPAKLRYASWFMLAGLVASTWLAYLHCGRSIEGTCFDALLLLGSFTVYVGLSRALLRFVLTWRAIRTLLRRLYWHPTRWAYQRFHELLPGKQAIQLSGQSLNFIALEVSLERARQIVRLANASATAGYIGKLRRLAGYGQGPFVAQLEEKIAKAERRFWETLAKETEGDWSGVLVARRETEKIVSDITAAIATLLENEWRVQTGPEFAPNMDKEIVEQGGLFIVGRTVDYLRGILPQLVSHAVFITVTMLLVVIGLSSFPFAAEDTLLWLSWLTVIAAVVLMAYVFISMNRDRILSLLAGTTPGTFSWTGDFTMHLLIYGLIPILGLLSISFPEALRGPVSWFGSLLGGHT